MIDVCRRFITSRMFIAVLVGSAALPAAGAWAVSPFEGWQARPPVHIRGHATTAPTGFTPAQIRAAYGFSQITNTGAGQIIAIVDAFDAPTIASDLATSSTTFGLPQMNTNCTVAAGPHPCFQKVYAQGSKPRTNSGWALEIALDVEWAHAIAPGADILLVEAVTNSFSNLLGAVDVAVNRGATVVSMSWGGSEFSTEATYDGHFNHAGVTFVASSGDSGAGVQWPAASPYVLSVGGTSLKLTSSGTYASETAWSGSGGGISAYESEPGYQSSYTGFPNTGGHRAVPDVAYIADTSPGVSVYDTTSYQGQKGWFAVGGTSVGAPQWAALIALANQARASALSTNIPYYTEATSDYAGNYDDITTGSDGSCTTCTATTGYDFVTGLGSPRANNLVPALTTY